MIDFLKRTGLFIDSHTARLMRSGIRPISATIKESAFAHSPRKEALLIGHTKEQHQQDMSNKGLAKKILPPHSVISSDSTNVRVKFFNISKISCQFHKIGISIKQTTEIPDPKRLDFVNRILHNIK